METPNTSDSSMKTKEEALGFLAQTKEHQNEIIKEEREHSNKEILDYYYRELEDEMEVEKKKRKEIKN